MALTKRIIPALDIKNGAVVKGVQFNNVKAVGEPIAIAQAYQDSGADELVMLDITASLEDRKTMRSVVDGISAAVFIPLTVGGGIRTVADMAELVKAGADKIFVNSAAINDLSIVTQGAQIFGSQAIVGAIDVKWDQEAGFYRVYVQGGTQPTPWEVGKWAQALVEAGAGELLVTSMDADGMQAGYDLPLYQMLTQKVAVPIIASGGAGTIEDFEALFEQTNVDGALAASVFHFNTIPIPKLKAALKQRGISIR
ncbi:imidazole glycerol phosphate synthase subunit HisF [Convivina intestini]|uniref:imidazole glycerol phosphate synthase subunit HisF n=1 Tax=Convivina intestini TaxID=1505726 RepID=UPI00200EBC4B|nr:imidazole glycerol phosphate synthase subunit HisF [Convivina intestini]CAH1850620.1 Imidazole glycerol phosphate synthase subunit HisF [Convivina intestini]